MLPYLSLALYIISLITSLILMITAKGRSGEGSIFSLKRFKAAAYTHLSFLILFLLLRFFISNLSLLTHLSFLFYFCSGAALCGWAMRSAVSILVKLYFLLFNASLVIFIVIPFNFSMFLLSGSFSETNEVKFPINEHYYITEQGNVSGTSAHPVYRVVKHRGMFNQTVQYNLMLNGTLDSIRVLNIHETGSATVRAYIKHSAAATSSDSSDIEIQLKQQPKNEIQRKI